MLSTVLILDALMPALKEAHCSAKKVGQGPGQPCGWQPCLQQGGQKYTILKVPSNP